MSAWHNLDSPRKRLSMMDCVYQVGLSMGVSVGTSIGAGLDDLNRSGKTFPECGWPPSGSHQDKRTQEKEGLTFCLPGVYFCWQVHLPCCCSRWFSHWCWNPSFWLSDVDWWLEAIEKSSQPLDCWGTQPHGFSASPMKTSWANSEGIM